MRYLHTMIRITDLEESLRFFTEILGFIEVQRKEIEAGRFTLIFLAAPRDRREGATKNDMPLLELTYNWDKENYGSGRNFGHLAYEVDNIYIFCQKLIDQNVIINRPPRDGNMAFIKSPDGISIELLQKGERLPPAEPWLSMPNVGSW